MLAMLGDARWKRQTAPWSAQLSPVSRRWPSAFRDTTAHLDRSARPRDSLLRFRTDRRPADGRRRIHRMGRRIQHASTPLECIHGNTALSRAAPGFVWDARIWMSSILPVLVRDAYADHEGSLRAAIGGVVKVADQRGTDDIARGRAAPLSRRSGLVSYGVAAECGRDVDGIDDDSATATLSDGATTVSLNAHFASRARSSALSAMRPRDVGRSSVLTPWIARLHGYTRRHGMMVPASGEVEWELESGPLPYWRGRVVSAHYDFAR